MSHLARDIITANSQKKPIQIGHMSGAEFKALLQELAKYRMEAAK